METKTLIDSQVPLRPAVAKLLKGAFHSRPNSRLRIEADRIAIFVTDFGSDSNMTEFDTLTGVKAKLQFSLDLATRIGLTFDAALEWTAAREIPIIDVRTGSLIRHAEAHAHFGARTSSANQSLHAEGDNVQIIRPFSNAIEVPNAADDSKILTEIESPPARRSIFAAVVAAREQSVEALEA